MSDSASYTRGILTRAGQAGTADSGAAALDRVVISGARGPSTLLRLRDLGEPWSPKDVLLTTDFQAPEVELSIPRSRALCRELSERFGFQRVFDLNMGIGSHVVLEAGLVRPGQLVAGSGRCLGVVGGVGALGVQLDEDGLARAMVSGRIDLPALEVVAVDLQDKAPRHLGPWDLATAVAAAAGGPQAGTVVELTGSAQEWSLDMRIGVCGLLREMGFFAALVPPDEAARKFFAERGVEVEPVEAGLGSFDRRVTLSAKTISPVTGAEYRGKVSKLAETTGESIHGVFIGSCYGGRYEDLALVAEVLKKSKGVHPGVRLVISPATLETARACLAAGFYEIFFQTGAMVVVPGGGAGNAGGGAIFGDGERLASTVEYHRDLHPGPGVPDVHLVSPATAAVAAVNGEFRDPATALT